MFGLVIWFVIWIVVGLLVGALASVVTRGEPPYGLAVDIVASVLSVVAVSLNNYYILPLMKITGVMRFGGTLFDPLISAVIVLWLLRFIKRRKGG